MSDYRAQLRWKGQLKAYPNPPCQHSLWEEIGGPGEKRRRPVDDSAARIDPTISEVKGLALTIAPSRRSLIVFIFVFFWHKNSTSSVAPPKFYGFFLFWGGGAT
jgi:hypothetical protein